MNKKKILFLTTEFPPQPGGIGNHAFNLALALQEKGKELTVLTDIRSKNGEVEKEFDLKQPFQIERVKRRQLLIISYLDRLFKAMRLIKNAEIVLASGKFSLWLVYFLKLFYSKKYIAIIHGSEVLLPNKIQRKFTDSCLKKFDTIVAVSNYTKTLVQHLKLKNMMVIPNGFTLQKNIELKQNPQSNCSLKLITVGNITQRKGQHNVVKAIPLLLKEFPDLQYHIVGIPTEKKQIENLAKSLNVSSYLIFHGKVSEQKKWELLQDSTIFIMLSETTELGDVEGFGIAILEANAIGLPAIGALGCGIEDAIDTNNSGVLVDAKNPGSISKAIVKINNNYTHFSESAINWSHHFSWDRIVKEYLKVIEK